MISKIINDYQRSIGRKKSTVDEYKPQENEQYDAQKNASIKSQEGQIDLGNEVLLLPETFESIALMDTQKNKVKLDENIEHVSSEITIIATKRKTPDSRHKKGIKKLRMVYKVGENHTSI